ncbi:MAG: acetyl-CoA carboxylase carboxyltransferase subunit alpha [Coriobacteriia bacterium]|nr:acetyl-CoA carboxylase carboxyltransferase subunit alpha [Coriobacteriia bacterium]MBN2847034.1 acetyl-CoA carboxylase carboxyltransferase subunit alpha [Coriobacteriia bacterium]
MARFVMEFERPLAELEEKLIALKALDIATTPELAAEIADLEREVERLRVTLYSALSPWEKVQVSRHPERPKTDDYVRGLFDDVVELRGDRAHADDQSMFTALATLAGRRVMVIGHNKGHSTKENVARNFGSPHPEGFRKAERAMRLAGRFGLPVVTFLDTAGASPGLEDEERGQAWAIARCLETLAGLPVPVVVAGIGEGGSGGALAIGFGDRMLMLEHSYYSVISPEMCAVILHKDAARAPESAAALSLTAADLLRLGIIDEVVPEPLGGAHREPDTVIAEVGLRIAAALDALAGDDRADLVERRYQRLRAIGVYNEAG